jgi:pimeloyl-ACP methyl ester carboxylesterase
MKRFLNFNKAMFQRVKKSKLAQSPTIWQQFAVLMLILGVVLPAALQAKTLTTANEESLTDMGTFIVEHHNNDSHKKAIIFIPGLMSNPSVYDGIQEQFNAQFNVHLIAVKGFAGTPQDGEFNFDNLLQELRAYIVLNKLNKPHIVGHSMGGLIGLAMAAEQEDIIGKVISIDGLPFVGPVFTRSNATQVSQLQPQAQTLKTMLSKMKPEQLAEQTKRGIFIQTTAPKDQAHIIEMAKNSDPLTAGNAMYEVMTRDLRLPLQASQTPILMLGALGAFTHETQYQQAQSLYEQQFVDVKNATVIMNTKARHFIMYDQPLWLVAQIRSFLEK